MRRRTAEFRLASLGDLAEPVGFDVLSDRVRDYARVTGDMHSSALTGEVAPPVFAALSVWDALNAATKRTVPPEIADVAVHLTQRFIIHTPLRAGLRVTSTAAAVGVFARRAGAEVTYRAETRASDGRLLSEQWLTELYRGVWPAVEAGDQAPDLEPNPSRPPDREVAASVPTDITERYAAVSGDDFAIHLDDEFARSVGLAGRIVHGLCTMALAVNALLLAYQRDVGAVRHLAVRFSRPLLPGRELRVSAWESDGGIAFSSAAGEAVVLRDGLLGLR